MICKPRVFRQRLRQTKPKTFAEYMGKAQMPVERAHHGKEAADLGTFGAGSSTEQLLQRGALHRVNPFLHRLGHDAGAFEIAQINPDLVFLNHGEIGIRRLFRFAQQRQNRRGLIPILLGDQRQRLAAPPARDQAIAAVADLHDLDRGLLAPVAQGGHERAHLGFLDHQTVAHEVIDLDLIQRQVHHHAALIAGAGHGVTQFVQRGRGRGIARHIGDGRGGEHRLGLGRRRVEKGRVGRCQAFTLGHGDLRLAWAWEGWCAGLTAGQYGARCGCIFLKRRSRGVSRRTSAHSAACWAVCTSRCQEPMRSCLKAA